MVTLILFVPPCHAWQIFLGWDGNTETDLAGYNLYESATPGGQDYSSPALTSFDATDTTAILILDDGTYCWTLTAFDVVGNESGASNEVCISLPNDAQNYDKTPPGAPGFFGVLEIVPGP